MAEQVSPTPQPRPRRLARGAYWRGLAAAFRSLKVPFSRVANRFQQRVPWTDFTPRWETLDDYAQWLPLHAGWRPDLLGGVLDFFPSLENIAAQFRARGRFDEDCDGLAVFSAQNVRQFADDVNDVYIITIVLDPFSFNAKALLYAAHVICVFRQDRAWRVISNTILDPQSFPGFADAVQHNHYCEGHPVLWCEVRDPRLQRLASGKHLAEVERRLESHRARRGLA